MDRGTRWRPLPRSCSAAAVVPLRRPFRRRRPPGVRLGVGCAVGLGVGCAVGGRLDRVCRVLHVRAGVVGPLGGRSVGAAGGVCVRQGVSGERAAGDDGRDTGGREGHSQAGAPPGAAPLASRGGRGDRRQLRQEHVVGPHPWRGHVQVVGVGARGHLGSLGAGVFRREGRSGGTAGVGTHRSVRLHGGGSSRGTRTLLSCSCHGPARVLRRSRGNRDFSSHAARRVVVGQAAGLSMRHAGAGRTRLTRCPTRTTSGAADRSDDTKRHARAWHRPTT